MAPSLCMFCICGSIRVADNDSNVIAVLFFLSSPVYVTQLRRNAAGVGLVFEADLDTAEHSSLWVLQVQHCACVTANALSSCSDFFDAILQGVALCLNIAD